MRVGGSFLASMHKSFPCEKAVRFYSKLGDSAAHHTLWGTFGKERDCLRTLFHLHSPSSIELIIYFSNEVCRRKGNCSRLDFLPRLSVKRYNKKLRRLRPRFEKVLARRALEILSFCEREASPEDGCKIVAGLESQFEKRALKRLIGVFKRVGWNEEDIVHNPVRGAPYLGLGGAYHLECHGVSGVCHKDPSRAIVSLDGTDPDFCATRTGIQNSISLPRLTDWLARGIRESNRVTVWCGVWQGIERGDSGNSVVPYRRTIRIPKFSIHRFHRVMRQVGVIE